jgi:hypothetical protein
MIMLSSSEAAGMKKAGEWKKHREGEKNQRSVEEWSFHKQNAFKDTLIRKHQRTSKNTGFTQLLPP